MIWISSPLALPQTLSARESCRISRDAFDHTTTALQQLTEGQMEQAVLHAACAMQQLARDADETEVASAEDEESETAVKEAATARAAFETLCLLIAGDACQEGPLVQAAYYQQGLSKWVDEQHSQADDAMARILTKLASALLKCNEASAAMALQLYSLEVRLKCTDMHVAGDCLELARDLCNVAVLVPHVLAHATTQRTVSVACVVPLARAAVAHVQASEALVRNLRQVPFLGLVLHNAATLRAYTHSLVSESEVLEVPRGIPLSLLQEMSQEGTLGNVARKGFLVGAPTRVTLRKNLVQTMTCVGEAKKTKTKGKQTKKRRR
ncbi:MAG: hypothetical protein MHM6MM_006902 [Cercozoa sp. M6MM]